MGARSVHQWRGDDEDDAHVEAAYDGSIDSDKELRTARLHKNSFAHLTDTFFEMSMSDMDVLRHHVVGCEVWHP